MTRCSVEVQPTSGCVCERWAGSGRHIYAERSSSDDRWRRHTAAASLRGQTLPELKSPVPGAHSARCAAFITQRLLVRVSQSQTFNKYDKNFKDKLVH